MNEVEVVEASRWLDQRMARGAARTPFRRRRRSCAIIFNIIWTICGKPEAIRQFLEGDSHCDPALDAKEWAAYASVGSLLLNLSGATTKG
jgi:hypothetical protein